MSHSEPAPIPQGLLTAGDLAERTGLSVRYFQKIGTRVKWATQPGGDGTAWLFQQRGFELWLESGCKAGGKWRTSTSAGTSTGRERRTRGRNIETPLTQHLRQLLRTG